MNSRLNSLDLSRRLNDYLEGSLVPGAQLGVLCEGENAVVGAGVLSKRTGLPVHADSVFQIGSNTKTWTATQAMQLVDAGTLDLDAPVLEYLPEFELADKTIACEITPRNLLSHTSGIPSNVPGMMKSGANPDKFEKYVASLKNVPFDVPTGVFSYSNSGLIVVGRIIEVLSGMSWEESLQQTLARPLGLDSVCVGAEAAILYGAATGHVKAPDGEYAPMPAWGVPPALGPAGAIVANAESVLAHNALHLHGRDADKHDEILSANSTELMQVPQVSVPGSHFTDAIGIGWMLDELEGQPVIQHGGGGMAQQCHNLAFPNLGIAIVLLQNAWEFEAGSRLINDIIYELTGFRRPTPAKPVEGREGPENPERFTGKFARFEATSEVTIENGQLFLATEDANLFGLNPQPLRKVRLLPYEDSLFLAPADIPGAVPDWEGVKFHGAGEDGRFQFLQHGVFTSARVL